VRDARNTFFKHCARNYFPARAGIATDFLANYFFKVSARNRRRFLRRSM
jgi:hypothetical protein